MKYDRLCEMNVSDLIKAIMEPTDTNPVSPELNVGQTVQPTDNVGEFGKTNNANEPQFQLGKEGLMIQHSGVQIWVPISVAEKLKEFLRDKFEAAKPELAPGTAGTAETKIDTEPKFEAETETDTEIPEEIK